jgi:hypothetical protein
MFTRLHDISVRVAEYCCTGMLRLVIQESPILLLKPVRHALVIVVEERDERTFRVREQGVPRCGNPSVRPVTNDAKLIMRPLKLL